MGEAGRGQGKVDKSRRLKQAKTAQQVDPGQRFFAQQETGNKSEGGDAGCNPPGQAAGRACGDRKTGQCEMDMAPPTLRDQQDIAFEPQGTSPESEKMRPETSHCRQDENPRDRSGRSQRYGFRNPLRPDVEAGERTVRGDVVSAPSTVTQELELSCQALGPSRPRNRGIHQRCLRSGGTQVPDAVR